MKKIFLPYLGLFALGFVYPFGFAPYNQIWGIGSGLISCLAVGGIWLWLEKVPLRSRKAHISAALVLGAGLFGHGVSWVYHSISVYGHAHWLLAGVITAGFCALLSFFLWVLIALYLRLRSQVPSSVTPMLFAAIWLLSEWLRSWVLTGFPWLLLGSAQIDSPLAGWIPVLGELGTGFLTALIGAGAFALLTSKQTTAKPRIIWAASILTTISLGVVLQSINWTQDIKSQPIQATMIQGNIPQDTKWSLPPQQIIRTHLRLSQKALAEHPDTQLLIWPENAFTRPIPLHKPEASGIIQTVDGYLEKKYPSLTLLAGVPFYEQTKPPVFYNGIISLGDSEGHYLKQRLVPFGEYVPFESLIRGLIAFFDLPLSVFSTGPEGQPPIEVSQADNHQLKVGALICYEVAYANLSREQAARSDVLVTISNDTWFGDSLGPSQHAQIARVRALENGKWMFRGTNDGYSLVIDPKGNILEKSERFQATYLSGTGYKVEGNTPFAYGPDKGLLLLILISLGWLEYRQRQASKSAIS